MYIKAESTREIINILKANINLYLVDFHHPYSLHVEYLMSISRDLRTSTFFFYRKLCDSFYDECMSNFIEMLSKN